MLAGSRRLTCTRLITQPVRADLVAAATRGWPSLGWLWSCGDLTGAIAGTAILGGVGSATSMCMCAQRAH